MRHVITQSHMLADGWARHVRDCARQCSTLQSPESGTPTLILTLHADRMGDAMPRTAPGGAARCKSQPLRLTLTLTLKLAHVQIAWARHALHRAMQRAKT